MMGSELRKRSQEVGLETNMEKTVILSKGPEKEVKLGDEKISWKEELTYLGKTISFKDRRGK